METRTKNRGICIYFNIRYISNIDDIEFFHITSAIGDDGVQQNELSQSPENRQ